MRIVPAKSAGFCFGVNRAVDMANELAESGKKAMAFGPLIHNPHVIRRLENSGIATIGSADQIENGATVIIRTHGIEKELFEKIIESGAAVCDATCPFVKKIHKIVEEKSQNNVPVFIAGDENHPEVRGIMSYCKSECIVFDSAEKLKDFFEKNKEYREKEITVVAQTTFSIKEWKNSIKNIHSYCTNANVFDTICNATQERQMEAAELSRASDCMIIIGGSASSNTAKLKAVCEENCKTFLVEDASGIEEIDFSECKSVGVTAGASTPAWIIKEVLSKMSEILNEQVELEETAIDQEEKGAVEPAAESAESEAEAAAEETVAVEPEAVPEEPKEEVPFDNSDTMSAEEREFSEALEESLKNMNTDQKVKGIVMGITPAEIQVDIGRKHTGIIPLDEYSSDPNVNPADELKIGDEIDLIIMKTNDAEGTVMLSKRRFDASKAWVNIIEAEKEETILEGVVTDVIKGGVLVSAKGARVFIPASLATESRGDSLDDLLKTNVKFKIIEVDSRRKRAVGSIRAVLREARKEAAAGFWEKAEVGQVFRGKVKSLTSYSAFVDLGGVDGMVHISELSWSRIKNPAEVLSIGDEVEVYIKALDPEAKRISLGYKKVEDNPWEILRRDYPEGSEAEVEVVGMTTFGAFARIIPGVDGLIHISQIANRHIAKPQDELNVGDVVKVKITAVDFEKKRVSLSIRALLDPMEKNEEELEEAPEAPAEEIAEVPVEETVEVPAEEASE